MLHCIRTQRRAASHLPACFARLSVVTAALMAWGGTARGQVDFDYDFEKLEEGLINGQDGWQEFCNPGGSIRPGPTINPSKTVTALGCSQTLRPLPEPFYYTPADTAVIWRCQSYVADSCCNVDALVGFAVAGGGNFDRFGISNSGQIITTYLDINGPTQQGDTLTRFHWYEFQVTIDFSVAGGLATLAYRDMTLNEDTFRIDETLRNANLGAIADGQGRYHYSHVHTRTDSLEEYRSFVDNIHFDAPRPPCPAHTGDMNADTAANGADVQRFIDALAAGSTAFGDTCPGDFNDSAVVDLPDVSGFISALLN